MTRSQMNIYITIDGELVPGQGVVSTSKEFPIDYVMKFNMHSEDF